MMIGGHSTPYIGIIIHELRIPFNKQWNDSVEHLAEAHDVQG